MIKAEFTEEEFILLMQGLSSRKKVFRAKIRNNEIQLSAGKQKLSTEELERNIRKRQKQIAEIDHLSEKLSTIAFRNDLEVPEKLNASENYQ